MTAGGVCPTPRHSASNTDGAKRGRSVLCYNRAFTSKQRRVQSTMCRRKYAQKCVSKLVVAVAGAALLAGCGSSSNGSSRTTPVTGLKKRVLLTNSVVNPSFIEVVPTSAGLIIMDAQKDTLAKALWNAPFSKILTASGITVLLNVGARQITIVDNTKEEVTFSPTLLSQPFDIALST